MPKLSSIWGLLTIGFAAICINSSSAQTVKKLDSLFSTLAKQGNLNGCVLIAEGGKPIYEKAFGYANFDTKQALTKQTMFELASVSKQFTAMAIMQLHEKGKLSYGDNLNKYFHQLPYPDITINNLLHHTSGIMEFLGWDEKQVDVHRINTNKDILAALVKYAPPVNFKPGDNLSYSNTNYVLLALIVEQVSGMPFADYLNKNIFAPLGMVHTKVYSRRADKRPIPDYALGYIFDSGKNKFVVNDSIRSNRYEYYFDGVAGPYGISSNTQDMLKWDQALYTNKLISTKEQDAAYITANLNDGKPAAFMGLPYGFGWLIMPTRDYTGRRYMHTGGYPGYMTVIARYPDKNKTIIILTNIWNVISLYQLSAATENILFDKPFTIPQALPFQKSVNLTPAQLNAVTGTYAFKDAPQVKIIISAENNQAYAQVSGQIKVEIYPESELDFFYTAVAAKIKFIKDETGLVKKMRFFQNGKEFEVVRE